jgi:uncharacterized protein (TIGR00645 family)
MLPVIEKTMKQLEHGLEHFMFNSRWLLVPFYLGLIGSIALLLVKFVKAFIVLAPTAFYGSGNDVLLGILSLVDTTLVANLLLIIIFAGYGNFVSKLDTAGSEDRQSWMDEASFSSLKLKLIGSLIAISGVDLLRYFVNLHEVLATEQGHYELGWAIGIHLTFVVSGIMFALTDRIAENKHGDGQK